MNNRDCECRQAEPSAFDLWVSSQFHKYIAPLLIPAIERFTRLILAYGTWATNHPKAYNLSLIILAGLVLILSLFVLK